MKYVLRCEYILIINNNECKEYRYEKALELVLVLYKISLPSLETRWLFKHSFGSRNEISSNSKWLLIERCFKEVCHPRTTKKENEEEYNNTILLRLTQWFMNLTYSLNIFKNLWQNWVVVIIFFVSLKFNTKKSSEHNRTSSFYPNLRLEFLKNLCQNNKNFRHPSNQFYTLFASVSDVIHGFHRRPMRPRERFSSADAYRVPRDDCVKVWKA